MIRSIGAALRPALPDVLHPSRLPWAWQPALWAVAAGAIVTVIGLSTGYSDAAGLAYFGVVCAAVFVGTTAFRTRVMMCTAQAGGAAVGIVLGVAVQDSVVGKVLLAAGVALISGAMGGIGRACAAGSMMAVVGVAFGEFARVPLPGGQQAGWYLVGSGVVLAGAIAMWPLEKDRPERQAVTLVLREAATTMLVAGTPQARAARVALAAASARCRSTVFDHRLPCTRAARTRLFAGTAQAEQFAIVAADCYSQGKPGSAEMIAAAQAAARAIDTGLPVDTAMATFDPPPLRTIRPLRTRLVGAVRTATQPDSLLSGLRLAGCMAIATTLTAIRHNESHSFWLPLTVAVAVRPEYASVYVRTVNRVIGTAAGGLLAAGLLTVWHSGRPVAAVAVLALGFAVLAAPRLYALSVMGLTTSALLSASIAHPDPSAPIVRIVDTALGAAIALIFGYLLWPGRRSTPGRDVARQAVTSCAAYLHDVAAFGPGEPPPLLRQRDDAYRQAHRAAAAVTAGLLEPGSARARAGALLPTVLTLEDLVDGVTAAAATADANDRRTELVKLERRLAEVTNTLTASP
jgi:Fusaric acid resistance protein-like